MPTEAEWELAARGPEGRIFAWGDKWKDDAAYDTRHPVGGCRLRDTPDGIHDLAGNGREWTSTGAGNARISKGMACMDELPCVAFNRLIQSVDEQLDYLGFRCAGSAPPGPPPPFAAAAPGPPKPTPTLHWSLLVDTFPTVRGPVRTRTVCFVDVRFDPSGRVATATALAEGRPQQPACPAPLRQLAEAAARKATTAPREAGAETALPVAIEP